MTKLTHIDESGAANMVDINDKAITSRTATAQSIIQCSAEVLEQLHNNPQSNPKGDVFAIARIAGIQGAKKCSDLIPLCHPLPLTKAKVNITINKNNIVIDATCKTDGKTGVEMEALTAASIAALTIYDMCKAIDKGMIISSTKLLTKTGGKSGDFRAK